MHALSAVRTIVRSAQGTLETALGDATSELINQTPPGTGNPIGAIYAHAVFNLDTFYSEGLLARDHVLTTGGFGERLGLAGPAAFEWDTLKAVRWEVGALQAYAQAVYATSEGYLDQLTEDELGRSVRLFERDMAVEDVLALAAWHTALHAGEIAALKGVAGARGLPF